MASGDIYTTLPLDLKKIPWVPVKFRSEIEERIHYLTSRAARDLADKIDDEVFEVFAHDA